MKKFIIEVPYREMVHGTVEYQVMAETLEDAVKAIESNPHRYHYDSEVIEAEHYEEFWEHMGVRSEEPKS